MKGGCGHSRAFGPCFKRYYLLDEGRLRRSRVVALRPLGAGCTKRQADSQQGNRHSQACLHLFLHLLHPNPSKLRRLSASLEFRCLFLGDQDERLTPGRNGDRVRNRLLCRGRTSGRLECRQRRKIKFSDPMEGRCA